MRTILFFDDWLIQDYRGVERKWFEAEKWPGVEPMVDKLLDDSFNYPSVLKKEKENGWEMMAIGYLDTEESDFGSLLCHYISDDGLEWKPSLQKKLLDRRANKKASHIVFSGDYASNGAGILYDVREKDPNRRYKIAYSDVSKNPLKEDTCKIAVSPDGKHWSIDHDAIWNKWHSDTGHSITYNPYTSKYQITTRSISGDRRISIVQTKDWKNFEKPFVVLSPDPMDEKCVEFYGMPHFFYEGYYIGLLWKMHSSFVNEGIFRMRGKVTSELTYSINGINWSRTSRKNFLPERPCVKGNFSTKYPSSMVLDDDGWIRVYTTACIGEHNDNKKFSKGEKRQYLTVSRFRRDGFCAMKTYTDVGNLYLRPLLFYGNEIKVNASCDKFGYIKAEIRDAENDKAFEGYEIENFITITGDGHFIKLRWKNKKSIDGLKGKAIKIYFEMYQAQIYALRLDADYLFGRHVHLDLNGRYDNEKYYWWAGADKNMK